MAFYLAFQCVVYQILDAFFTRHQFYLMLIETKTKLNGQSLQFVIFFCPYATVQHMKSQ